MTRRTGRALFAAGAVVAALSACAVLAASALAAPTLVSFTAPCPYERVGMTAAPIATVELDGPAEGDTTVTLASSQPTVATVPGGSVTVANGSRSASVPVSAFSEGNTTLTATLGATMLQVQLKVGGVAATPEVPTLSLAPSSVTAGEASTATVTLDFIAPSGGTVVTLASDNPGVTVPAELDIAENQCRGTFTASSTSAATGTADLTATLGSNVAHATLTVTQPAEVPGGGGSTPPAAPEVPPATGGGSPSAPPTGTTATVPAPAGPTGKRAAAVRRCKRKFRHAKARRAKCLKKARSLPL